jgi:hypothetical protein
MIFILGLGFGVGFYLYRIDELKNNESNNQISDELVDDECTKLADIISTVNTQETKVSPNCTLTVKILYKQCNHLIETSQKINDQSLINLTQEEFEKKYDEWEVQKFTSSEIVIYKEIDDFCNEHYKLKDKDGYVTIYKIDKNNNEIFQEQTSIKIKYLTDKDIENIKNGILVYTKKELNKTLEDFE